MAAFSTHFGEFVLELEEAGTGQLLSDDHSTLVLLILPAPSILNSIPERAVVTSMTSNTESALGVLQVRIDIDWGPAAFTEDLEIFRHNYLE